ncbi:MAG: TetR family transcriptional regulator C-terminal domain-containing protein, partial [SAR324 cluster bacterium]|nr:TetR family transcriptional regulator C-terminal domain-containing protein [SAR324 cluster bacterium]
AEEAGLPKANLHYYFQTKEQLYRQVLERIFKDWLAAANTYDECEEPVEALRGYIEIKMDLSRKRPLESRIWAEEILRGAPLIQDQLEQTLAAWLDTRVKRITDWINKGTIQAMNPRILMYMIWAVTQHFADFESQIRALNQQQNLSDEQFDEAKTQVVQTILKGIGALD